MVLRSLLLNAFVVAFLLWLVAYLRPWKARDPRSRHFVGVGAFNLVRMATYLAADGHESIRLRPDDDIKLGKVLKRSGARQDVLSGRGMVSVEWYSSLGEAVEGLMKNSFAVVQYHPLLGVLGALLIAGLGVGPLLAVLFGSGTPRLLGGIAAVFQLGLHLRAARESGAPYRTASLYPVMSLLLAWIVLRAMTLTMVRGGIVWRGTFYPLAELRRNRV
jgi:hypothetical protein